LLEQLLQITTTSSGGPLGARSKAAEAERRKAGDLGAPSGGGISLIGGALL